MNKLNEVEQLLAGNEKSIVRLIELSTDDDEEVRYRAVEALGHVPLTSETVAAIKGAVTDSDDLVRSSAIETLGSQEIAGAEELLVGALTDESELVRTAAIVSLGTVGSQASIWTLEKRYRARSCGDAEMLACAVALYSLGKSKYLSEALEYLANESYRLRCAAANLLGAFTATKDISIVVSSLRSALKEEKTSAARSSICNAIEELEPI